MRTLGIALYTAALAAQTSPYLGRQACAPCHREIAAMQSESNMARTWRAIAAPPMSKTEETTRYAVTAGEGGLAYHVEMKGREPLAAPVEAMVGGERHGISLLVRLNEIEGIPLERAPLIETRYLNRAGALILSPGFPEQPPISYETGIGRVLSPAFEKKCLTCHGSPAHTPTGRAGVECETCHGPGRTHLDSISKGKPGGIVNPAKLGAESVLETCGQCHSGFSNLIDPLPQDVLISNQVTAIRNTECFIQTGGGFSCISCHNPHRNAKPGDASYTSTCLGCHAAGAQKAAVCPVNASENCVSCHMPRERHGSFELVDHWIRVHPETGKATAPAARSHIAPRRVFLKMIISATRGEAETVRAELAKGRDFFELAREHSLDPSGAAGGFLGEMRPAEMEPALGAVARQLAPGETSGIVETRGRFAILQRLPRDFRWRAIALEEEGTALKAKGERDAAIAKYQDALRIDPTMLRALVLLGATVGETGARERAIAILEQATILHPNDPSAQYNLGIAYGAAGRAAEEAAAYRRALELEPDLVPAYLNLAAALLGAGRNTEAADLLLRGIRVNPLSATLYYNLGLARQAEGRGAEARRAFDLARKIDPRFAQLKPD